MHNLLVHSLAVFVTGALASYAPDDGGTDLIVNTRDEPVNILEVCDKDFVAFDGIQARAMLYCGTEDLQRETARGPISYPGYRRLVIAQHGRRPDARMYFDRTQSVAEEVGVDHETFIVAPQLLRFEDAWASNYDAIAGFIEGWHMRWNHLWVLGARSIKLDAADFGRSSYEMLNAVINQGVARLPDLEEVVVFGQSGGGQLVNRYAAASLLNVPRGVRVRYVPMNPRSWLYLDDSRPFPELALAPDPEGGVLGPVDPESIDLHAECPGFNDYHLGLDKLEKISYFGDHGLTAQILRSKYMYQRVIYMVGEHDTSDPDGSFTCTTRVQGLNRNERAKAYYNHVRAFFYPIAVNHTFHEIPGSDHGIADMIKSQCARRWIFDDPTAVCE
jgi:hypothetical protein